MALRRNGSWVPASGQKAVVATRSLLNWRSTMRLPLGSARQATKPFQPPMMSVSPLGVNRQAPTGADAAKLVSFRRSVMDQSSTHPVSTSHEPHDAHRNLSGRRANR